MGAQVIRGEWPDARGRFGEFGGRFVPETLMHPVEELEQAYEAARRDPNFHAELDRLLRDFAGRPTPLFHARGSRNAWAARSSTSSARTCSIRALTRSTIALGKACSRAGW